MRAVLAVRAASRLGLDYVVNHKADSSKSGYAEKVSRRRSFRGAVCKAGFFASPRVRPLRLLLALAELRVLSAV